MSRDVRVVARAKLTLSLRVLGVRPDGYHELEALVVSLREPYDVVGLRIQPPFGVRVRLSGRAVMGVPADDTNLAARAARLLLDAAAEGDDPGPWAASGLDISLHKAIPAGAGLGGGSADAAGTLVGGARLLGLNLDTAALAALGAELGSDVPFCVGGGIAWMRGRGELIEPLPALPPTHWLAPSPAGVPSGRSGRPGPPAESRPYGPGQFGVGAAQSGPSPESGQSGEHRGGEPRTGVPLPPGASRLPEAAPPPGGGSSGSGPWVQSGEAGQSGDSRGGEPRTGASPWPAEPELGGLSLVVAVPPSGVSPPPPHGPGSACPTS
jgi:hypothetical protein